MKGTVHPGKIQGTCGVCSGFGQVGTEHRAAQCTLQESPADDMRMLGVCQETPVREFTEGTVGSTNRAHRDAETPKDNDVVKIRT